MRAILRVSFEAARSLLAVAFVFFGFMKATLPMAELARHGAWVADLPPAVARTVGVLEILCALALSPLVPWRHASIVRAAAALLLLNQAIAIAQHVRHAQLGALTLNALWCALAVWVLVVYGLAKPPPLAKRASAA